MTDSITPSEPSKQIPIPKNAEDREFWLECFSVFSDLLISARLEKGTPRDIEALEWDIADAAKLADKALNEALFRNWVAADHNRKKRKPQVKRKIARRK